MPPLDLSIRSSVAGVPVARLRRQLLAAHQILDPPLRELSVAFVGLAAMATVHQKFLRIPTPTDVLTFELDHDNRGRVISGEIVVCIPVAIRSARVRGIDPWHETLLYALHGMLHLCGFDDRTDRGFAAMHRREDDILKRLGIGPVFHADAPMRRRRRPLPRDRRTP